VAQDKLDNLIAYAKSMEVGSKPTHKGHCARPQRAYKGAVETRSIQTIEIGGSG
jgi:hypothetical protein